MVGENGVPETPDWVFEPTCDWCQRRATRIVGDIGGGLACDQHADLPAKREPQIIRGEN